MRKTMVISFLLALFLQGAIAFAQTVPVTERLKEINRDVWVPFLEGVRKNEDSLYLNVHSKDFIRLEAERKVFLNFPDYVDDTRRVMQRYKERGTQVVMDVRFVERIINDQFASEKGVGRVVITAKNGEVKKHFGRFHAISRKENGVWKIVTQYLTSENGAVTEEQFNRAFALDDVEAFR